MYRYAGLRAIERVKYELKSQTRYISAGQFLTNFTNANYKTIVQSLSYTSLMEREKQTTVQLEKKKAKKKPRAKPKGVRAKGLEQKSAAVLLAELPFVNTEAWTDLGFATSEKSQQKRKRGDGSRGASEEDGNKKTNKLQRPNYFVSIPITNAKIAEGIKTVQDLIIQKDHRLGRALIPVGSLHITLLVTHLSSEEEVNTAVGAMAETGRTLSSVTGGRSLLLPFCGIDNFKNEVTFVRLSQGEHVQKLEEIAGVVRQAFQEKGLPSGDTKAFKPHLTFMKLSRAPGLRRQGIRKLDPSLYEDFVEHNFGDEMVSRLDLCSMLKKKTAEGYYHCETSITLDLTQTTPYGIEISEKEAEPDEEELLSLSKRLVEDAVLKAVQQYMEEAKPGTGTPAAQASLPLAQNSRANK